MGIAFKKKKSEMGINYCKPIMGKLFHKNKLKVLKYHKTVSKPVLFFRPFSIKIDFGLNKFF